MRPRLLSPRVIAMPAILLVCMPPILHAPRMQDARSQPRKIAGRPRYTARADAVSGVCRYRGFTLEEGVAERLWPPEAGWRSFGVSFVPAQKGRVLLEVVDARNDVDVLGWHEYAVDPNGIDAVVAFRLGPSDSELTFASLIDGEARPTGRFTLPNQLVPARKEQVAPGWEDAGSGGFESRRRGVITEWSWNGEGSGSLARCMHPTDRGFFSMSGVRLDDDANGKALKEWPRPVWFLWGTFIPDPGEK